VFLGRLVVHSEHFSRCKLDGRTVFVTCPVSVARLVGRGVFSERRPWLDSRVRHG
jgi:hypothetical protein